MDLNIHFSHTPSWREERHCCASAVVSDCVICDLGEIVAFISVPAECRKGYLQVRSIAGPGSAHDRVHVRAASSEKDATFCRGEEKLAARRPKPGGIPFYLPLTNACSTCLKPPVLLLGGEGEAPNFGSGNRVLLL